MNNNFWKSRKIQFLLIIEVVVICLFVFPFFKPLSRYEYDSSQIQCWSEYGVLLENGYYISEQNMADEKYVGMFTYNPSYNLPRGSYRVTVNYETDTENNVVYLGHNSNAPFNSLRCDEIMLSPTKNSMTFNAYLTSSVQNVNMITRYGGVGGLLVTSGAIERTRDLEKSELAAVLFWITLVNVIVWLNVTGFFKRISREQINVGIILAAAVGYLFYPFCVDKLIEGSDLVFHLLRIESVKDSILAGELFPKIHPAFMEGYGYATGVFYPDMLLYFPALLRLIGFPIQTSYKIYIFAVNIATCATGYLCLKGIAKNRYIAALGTVMYLYAPFRLFGLYRSHTVGATAALIFVPLVVLGLYRIYTMDVRDKNYKYSFALPVIGYAGLLNTHILTTEMVGIFTILVCILCIKKTLRKETFPVLFATAAIAVLLSLGFLVPFLDYYLFGEFKINAQPEKLWIQVEGLQLSQLLQIFPAVEPNSTFSTADNLVYHENTGVSVLILAGVFVYAYFMADEEKRKRARHMWIPFGVGAAALFLTTCYFPWDVLRKILDNLKCAFLVDSLQFPPRFMQLAPFMLIVSGCYGLKMLLEDNQKAVVKNVVLCAAALTVLSSTYLINHALAIQNERTNYDLQRYTGRHTWSLEEYLPKDTDLSYLTAIGTVAYDDVKIHNFDKKYLDIRMDVTNGGGDSCVDLPLLYYKGYRAVDGSSRELNIYESDNNNVARIDVPAGYSGSVHVYFRQPFVWRMAEGLSVVLTIAFVSYLIYCRRKKYI